MSDKQKYGIDEKPSQSAEGKKKKALLEELDLPVIGREAVNIRRVNAAALSQGTEVNVKLSPAERLLREGWKPEKVLTARKGDHLVSCDGEIYEVTEVKKDHLKVKNIEQDYTTEIYISPRIVKAHEYRYRIRDSLGKPKDVKVHDMIFRDRSAATADLINELVSAIPAQHLNSFDEIRLDTQNTDTGGKFKKNESMAFGDKKVITLYIEDFLDGAGDVAIKPLLEVLYHELGHAVAMSLKGSAHPGPRWTAAKKSDGNELSEYSAKTRYEGMGDEGEIEDFAEACMIYIATDGARGKHEVFRRACPARFEILDEIFGNPINQQRANTNFLVRKITGDTNPLK